MSTIRKKSGYWIPTENEWYKAAYFDPTLNSGNGGYWNYATRSNSLPATISVNDVGDGSAGANGNFANYNLATNWNDGYNPTTVGTNGGPSYYGTYDQTGNMAEWNDTVAIFLNYFRLKIVRGGSHTSGPSTMSKDHRHLFDLSGELSLGRGFRIATTNNPLDLSNMVDIGDLNNPADSNGFGSVNYNYKICMYEITNNEYVEFLNAVATTDLYSLYIDSMSASVAGGILRSGTSNSYSYAAKTNMGNKPVSRISWFHAARYCNWLTNGKPTGNQDASTTESGIYPLYGETSGIIEKNLFKIRKLNTSYKIRS